MNPLAPASPARAMLLAAGRGERMRPLTDACPKPLLVVHGKPLMQWHLEALARSGCRQVVVNTDWLGEQIVAQFGDPFGPETASDQLDLALRYSHEGHDFGGALETAGGIVRALPLLDEVFWVLAADVFTPGFEFSQAALDRFAASDLLAHLWLVPNPAHNPAGDFGLQVAADGALALALNLSQGDPRPRHTFSTIGLYRRALFEPPWCDIAAGNPQGLKAPLAPLLRRAMDHGRVSAELYQGPWTDVGTPQRLAELNV
ncbi:nucleotidyltransferase family protein [Rhodoferax sp.]|uniref:nucleotidyltransferase family protein n=1 Tax=Rhodoferax sp. TaxID=50421 RepID=UPI0025FBF3DE|nr:nucleotidyltransferase family protein [Rhodoferax sp.]